MLRTRQTMAVSGLYIAIAVTLFVLAISPIFRSLQRPLKERRTEQTLRGQEEKSRRPAPLHINEFTNEFPNQVSHSITIATAYFDTKGHSKHGSNEYMDWLKNFFPKVHTPMVIFTDDAFAQSLLALRKDLPTTIISYDVFDLPPFRNVTDILKSQHSIDPERDIHFPELYFIWDAKPWMLHSAAELNPYDSDYFFWVDSGSFRHDHKLKHWPDIDRVQHVFRGNEDRVLFGNIAGRAYDEEFRSWHEDKGPFGVPFTPVDIIQATFFGGHAAAVKWFHDEFLRLFHKYIAQGIFVGKEQTLFNVACFDHVDKILVMDVSKGSCGDPWWYFQQFLASKRELNDGCPQPDPIRWV